MDRRVLAGTIFVVLTSHTPATQPADGVRLRASLDLGWRFHRGAAPGAEAPAFDDGAWRVVDVPHDWSLEDLPADDPTRDPVLALVPGEWRFRAGDDSGWASPSFHDEGWERVTLPAPWPASSSGSDQPFGWYRRRFDVPGSAAGRDVIVDVGRIDDADETFVNGVKVGHRGAFPPAWYDPLWSATWPFARYYRVPSALLKRDGTDVIAVRVFGGPGRGGIYAASDAARAIPTWAQTPAAPGRPPPAAPIRATMRARRAGHRS
jgi:hypothetical protein